MEKEIIEEEQIEDILKRYKKSGYGIISKIYSIQEEYNVYKYAAEILSKRYGHIISKEKIFDVISRRGHIFTMLIKNREAFYEVKTANIGIQHFLDKFTEGLLHEIIHKLGFEQSDTSFHEMSTIFKEAGTEIVSAEALSNNKYGRELIFPNTWAKYPEKTDDSFLTVCLANQINLAIGGETLERSILSGKDYFKPAIINKWGEATYVFLKENIEDLSRIEEKFWKDYEFLPEDEINEKVDEMRNRIGLIQNAILQAEFDKRIVDVSSKEDATKFLKDLLRFEENRARIKQTSFNKDDCFIDLGFETEFNRYKNDLESQFGVLPIEYDENTWEKKYKNKEILHEITDEEKKEIALLSIEFKRRYKKKNYFRKMTEKLFGRKQKMLEDNNIVNKGFERYKVDIDFKNDEKKKNNPYTKDEVRTK